MRWHYSSKTLIYLAMPLLVAAAVGTLAYGELPLNLVLSGAWSRLTGCSSGWNALLDERLPRLIVILCSGASLAVSGAVMQSLFQNPLASPSVLGVSCGGSLCVVVAFLLGYHSSSPYILPIAAVCGSLGTLFAVYAISRSRGRLQLHSLILTGIAVSTFLVAVQSALLFSFREEWQTIQTVTEWEAGSTLNCSWRSVHLQLPLALVGLAGCCRYRAEIDIIALGDDEAINLGVDVDKIRWRLFVCIALLIGGTLASIGIIAFFGLVLPHLLRNLQGPRNITLIPLSVLWGSALLAALDLTLRLSGLYMFSIGNVSAILGGFFFVFLLFKRQNSAELYS